MKININIQLIIAALLALAGILLLFYGASVDPEGQIHDSVLVAFGEVATFAGSVIGVDYKYKYKNTNNDDTTNEKNPNGEGSPGECNIHRLGETI